MQAPIKKLIHLLLCSATFFFACSDADKNDRSRQESLDVNSGDNPKKKINKSSSESEISQLQPRAISSVDPIKDWHNILTHESLRRSNYTRSEPVFAGERTIVNEGIGNKVKLLSSEVVVRSPRQRRNQHTVIQLEAPEQDPTSGEYPDAAPILRAAIERLANLGKGHSGRIELGSARPYYFHLPTNQPVTKYPAVLIQGLTDVEIVGKDAANPPRFIFRNPFDRGIQLINCRRVRLANISINYDFEVNIPGRGVYGKAIYEGVSLGGGNISVKGLPRDFINSIDYVRTFNPATGFWFNSRESFAVLITDSMTFLRPDPMRLGHNIFHHPRFAKFSLSSKVGVLHKRLGYRNAVDITGVENEDITIDGLKILTYPQMGLRVDGGRGIAMINNEIVPSETNTFSGRADGLHVTASAGDIIIRNNKFRGLGDDGINFRGGDLPILDITSLSPFTIKVDSLKNQSLVNEGDILALVTNELLPLHLAKVSKIDTSKLELQLDLGQVCTQECRRNIEANLEFRNPPESRQRGVAFNLTRASSRFIIDNNEISAGSGRGILVRSPNGRVNGNKITGVRLTGIWASAEIDYYSEGPAPINVSIVDNHISASDYGYYSDVAKNAGISVMTPHNLKNVRFPMVQAIVIKNNCVRHVGYAGILVSRAHQVEISGNELRSLHKAGRIPGSAWNGSANDLNIPIGSRESSDIFIGEGNVVDAADTAGVCP